MATRDDVVTVAPSPTGDTAPERSRLDPDREALATELFMANSSETEHGVRVLDFDAFVAAVVLFDTEADPNEVRESLQVLDLRYTEPLRH